MSRKAEAFQLSVREDRSSSHSELSSSRAASVKARDIPGKSIFESNVTEELGCLTGGPSHRIPNKPEA